MKEFNRVILWLVFIFASFTSLAAQESGVKTLFWEISGKDLTKPSYLFGTMHIIPKSEFRNFDVADDLLERSERLVLEMEIDVPLKQQMEWAKLMMLPEGQLISDFTDEDNFTRLRSYAIDSLEIKEFLFNAYIKMKPFAFYSALIPHAIGKKIEGFELHFSKIATKKEIPVFGLESFEYQMAIFDSIPYPEQINLFFDEDLDLRNEMYEMLEIYWSQDIYAMAGLVSEENSEYARFEEKLLSMRNQNWAGQLENLMPEYSCFVAVGAAHLAGPDGLIRLLREKGYTVNPVCLVPGCDE